MVTSEEKPAENEHKILLVDDHPVFCLGMGELIRKARDLLVIGCEETKAEEKVFSYYSKY